MNFRQIIITISIIMTLFNTLQAQDNVETTLEDLLVCKETWGSVFNRDLANGSTMADPRNIKKVYLSKFTKKNNFYAPKKEMKIFGGTVVTFSATTAGMSPGVSVLLDMDFEIGKKKFEDNYQIIFDECKQAQYDKACYKKISKSKSFILYEAPISQTKKGVIADCASAYRR